MYTAYYGFREKPFALSPDPRFLYLSESHREVLGHLIYGIEQGEGFMAITGEVGTGKTTLCRTLLRRLGRETEVAFLFNPTLTPVELLKAINAEFGLSTFGNSRPELTDVLNTFLLEQKSQGRRALLIIDEAQNLSTETLEQLRLLSNLETETSKLLQIVLLGQPELDQILAAQELRQLRQRISVWWYLGTLTAHETREYVRHRLRVAGGLERPIFTESALRAVHRASRGVPRLVNVVCDRALLAGYAEQRGQIGRGLVLRAAAELQPPRHRRRSRVWLAAASGAGAALLAVGLLALRRPAPPPDPSSVAAAPPVRTPAESAREDDAVGSPAWPDSPFVVEIEPDAAAPGAGGPDPAPTPAASGDDPAPVPGAGSADGPADDPPAAVLDSLLPLRAPAETRAATLDAAFAAWRLPPSGADRLEFDDLRARLDGRHLRLLPVDGVASLRRVGRPAIVSLRSPDGRARLALVRALADDRADLEGVLPGRTVRVSVDELERHLDGGAWAIWRDFENLPAVLRRGDEGPGVAWVQGALAELGYYAGGAHGRFDEATAAGVQRFQADRGLAVDGVVGPRTQMQLYASLPAYATPALLATPVDLVRSR